MRRCLGESFAELDGLLIMATLTSKVRLRLVDEQTILPNPLFTLRQNIPVHMTIESVGTPELYPTTVYSVGRERETNKRIAAWTRRL